MTTETDELALNVQLFMLRSVVVQAHRLLLLLLLFVVSIFMEKKMRENSYDSCAIKDFVETHLGKLCCAVWCVILTILYAFKKKEKKHPQLRTYWL